MSKDIVLATSNPGKVKEIQALLENTGIHVRPQADFNILDAVEDGLTFVENAIIKARNATKYSGLPALADDSGIEVDHLNGLPGIYSARYAGGSATNEENNEKLLRALEGVPHEARTARFQCVIVYLKHEHDPTPLICQGTWEGYITDNLRGKQGFGYDPLFYVPEHECTSAELDPATKNKISHRGQALIKLLDALQKNPEHPHA